MSYNLGPGRPSFLPSRSLMIRPKLNSNGGLPLQELLERPVPVPGRLGGLGSGLKELRLECASISQDPLL